MLASINTTVKSPAFFGALAVAGAVFSGLNYMWLRAKQKKIRSAQRAKAAGATRISRMDLLRILDATQSLVRDTADSVKERVRREGLRDTSTAFEEELKEKQATVLDTFGVTESDVQVALEAQKEDPSVRLKLGAIRRIAIQYTLTKDRMFDIVEEVYDALTPKLEDILQKAVQLTGGDPSQMQMATTQLMQQVNEQYCQKEYGLSFQSLMQRMQMAAMGSPEMAKRFQEVNMKLEASLQEASTRL